MRKFILTSLALLLLASMSQAEVTLQAFYWQPKELSSWYKILESKAEEFKDIGIDSIWIPSVSEDRSDYKMGYLIYDHYNFNSNFGTEEELKSMIHRMHSNNIQVYVDAVLNHMSGGEKEYNPYTDTYTYTRFLYPHHRFDVTFEDFQPSKFCPAFDTSIECHSWGPQLCTKSPRVQSHLIEWTKWLHEYLKIDGYRVDAAKCLDPSFLSKWSIAYPMSDLKQIGEYWTDSIYELDRYIKITHRKMQFYDFPQRRFIRDLCNDTSGNFSLRKLVYSGLSGHDSEMAVTFVENHDTDKDPRVVITSDKMLGYSYNLMLKNDTTIFYKDLFVYDLKDQITDLIKIRKKYTKENGFQRVLFLDEDFLVMQRDNLIYMLNDSRNPRNMVLKTPWKNATIIDATSHINDEVQTDENGMPINYKLWCPARNYVCWVKK